MPNLTDVTPAQRQLVKDLLIKALGENRRTPGHVTRPMTRAQVKNAWSWIEWLDGPGEVVSQ